MPQHLKSPLLQPVQHQSIRNGLQRAHGRACFLGLSDLNGHRQRAPVAISQATVEIKKLQRGSRGDLSGGWIFDLLELTDPFRERDRFDRIGGLNGREQSMPGRDRWIDQVEDSAAGVICRVASSGY